MQPSTVKRHYIMRSLILLGFTLLLADLIVTGRLSHYLAPRLHMLSYVTVAILALLTAVSIRQAVVGPDSYECDCGDAHKVPRSPFTALVVYGLFALPLVMGLVLPDKTLGSAVAEKRGVTLLTGEGKWVQSVGSSTKPGADQAGSPAPDANAMTDGTEKAKGAGETGNTTVSGNGGPGRSDAPEKAGDSGSPNQSAPQTDEQIRQRFAANSFGDFYTDIAVSLYKQPVIHLDDKLFLDGLTTMELYAKEFAGKELETLGFVYREPVFTPQQFVVARFSVSCCTADATVFGILVEDKAASKWATDSWVKVRGKLELRSVDGYDRLVLKASRIQPVKAPKDPYVYYDFNAAAP